MISQLGKSIDLILDTNKILRNTNDILTLSKL